jgi:uroporphyrinogen-III decarboxylase
MDFQNQLHQVGGKCMNPEQRVLTACAFEQPDKIPTIDCFWSFSDSWQACLGSVDSLSDVVIWAPNEGAFPSQARLLRQEGDSTYEIDRWGRTLRSRQEAYFSEILATPISEQTDLDSLSFEAPDLDSRFLQVEAETLLDQPLVCQVPSLAGIQSALYETKSQSCLFGKTGGPYLRSSFLRGEADFLMEIVANPSRAKALADKVADHLAAVGVQEIMRWNLQKTGIWICDDIAYNGGPLISPRSFERVFLPAYRRMVNAFKKAGARYVFFHSDGDIRLLLDMLIDAGIDGINPVEPRAHMKVAELRLKYPHLILAGGMDNTGTLVHGPRQQIEEEARAIIDVGRDGGVIIGSASIGPDVPLENFAAYHTICQTYGAFAPAAAETAARD